MSLIEIKKGIMKTKLPKKEAPTAKVAWEDAFYIPGKFSAGMAETISGKTIGPEMRYNEILLILKGEAEIVERKTGEKYIVKRGDAILLKEGAKVTITVKKPIRYLYVTIPPHSELAEVYYLEKEE
jgi:uncharacterized cupin superfamily protein